MSQDDIMSYLDNNKGKTFTVKELVYNIKGSTDRNDVQKFYRQLRQIIKRDEYFSEMIDNSCTKVVNNMITKSSVIIMKFGRR